MPKVKEISVHVSQKIFLEKYESINPSVTVRVALLRGDTLDEAYAFAAYQARRLWLKELISQAEEDTTRKGSESLSHWIEEYAERLNAEDEAGSCGT